MRMRHLQWFWMPWRILPYLFVYPRCKQIYFRFTKSIGNIPERLFLLSGFFFTDTDDFQNSLGLISVDIRRRFNVDSTSTMSYDVVSTLKQHRVSTGNLPFCCIFQHFGCSSTSFFSIPGICATEIHNLCAMQKSRVLSTTLLQVSDFILSIFSI